MFLACGEVRLPEDGSLVLPLRLVTVLRDVERVTAGDLELPLPGFVLTTFLELEEELRGAVRTVAGERDEELRELFLTTALDLFAEELPDEERTAVPDRFEFGVLLTAFFTAGELFFELLVRTEVVLDLLLFDPDLRCASAPRGAASMAIKIMMTTFFMISGFYLLFQSLHYCKYKFFAKVPYSLYSEASEVSVRFILTGKSIDIQQYFVLRYFN